MENVKKFLELVKTDEELARKVVELKDSLQDGANLGSEVEILAEKVLPLAKAHGIEFTAEEFLAYANSMSGELSDDDLLNVSGGISARGVALGLLFATGLSFMPTIISNLSSSAESPPAPETSISQSYSSELEENSAMELKEREAEKEVRSSRDDVRRAGDQVRTARKRVDTLKSKLRKEASVDDINDLSKKKKKKFSKLINQIARAEEDLTAAQQKLDVARGQTETAEGAKSEIKKNNVKIRTERKEREETEKNKKQFREVMTELLEAKKEQQEEAIVEEKKEAVTVGKAKDENAVVDYDAAAGHTDVNDEKVKKADLVAKLEKINDEIDDMYYDGKKTEDLSQKYNTLKTKMNSGEFDLTQVEKDLKALETLVDAVKGGKDVSQVDFAGEARSWDGTIENLYNCLKKADFDTDRIENFDKWEDSCEKALKMMTVYNDTLQIYQRLGTSCGSNVKDYKHKAMLKTLALFAMEGYKQDGAARKVTDPSTAAETDVKIDVELKEFVGGKK